MRVATIFTGVAAMTVGVTQAANAQDVAHPAAKPTAKHIAGTIRPAGRFDGSIQYDESCANTGAHPTWLHVSTTGLPGWVASNAIGSVCFGNAGIYSSPPGVGIYGECGGNNSGHIYGENKGKLTSLAFGPGTTYRNFIWSHYDDVLITKWTGADKCPQAKYWGYSTGQIGDLTAVGISRPPLARQSEMRTSDSR
jgi:hypothetical protein